MHSQAERVLREGVRVFGVRVRCREGWRDFTSHVAIDATGDGELAKDAGVPFEQGRDGDGLTQPLSIMFTIDGLPPGQRVCCGSEEEARTLRVHGRTWEDWVETAQKAGELPPSVGVIRLYAGSAPNENIVNATQINRLDGANSCDLTRAEIEGRRQAYAVLRFLRATLPGYEQARISAMPAVVGVRETRRFRGTRRLEKDDCLRGARFADAAVCRAAFPIDIHNPDGGGQFAGRSHHFGGAAERVRPYDIPFGVMLPETVDGLLFTGRCISASHEALASCRVMRIAMALGVAAGAAAALAAARRTFPRNVPPADIRALLSINGAILPDSDDA